MAEQFQSFSEALETVSPTERKYPWSKWTNGSPWRVEKGRDFDCGRDSFVAMLRTRARNVSMKVTVQSGVRQPDGTPVIAFQFYRGARPCKTSTPTPS